MRVDFQAVVPNPGPEIHEQGEQVGRIQVLRDGALSMQLHAFVVFFEYDLTGEAQPSNYSLQSGRLELNGVKLAPPPDSPYLDAPTIALFADPEN